MINPRWLSNRPPLGAVVMTCVALWLASCSDSDTSTTENLPFTNVQEIPANDLVTAPVYHPSLKLQVGRAIENNAEREFRYIGDMAIDSTGNVYVKDGVVRVYRPDGTFSHQIGERGEGPASVQRASQIAVIGDTLVAVSFPDLRFFHTSGKLLFQKRRPPGNAQVVGATGKGIYILDLMSRPSGSLLTYNDTLGLLATTTTPSDPVTILSRNVFVRKWVRFKGRGGDGRHSWVGAAGPPLLGVMPRGTVAYDGSILFTDPDSFAIHVRDTQGDPAKTIVARVSPVETTRQDREDFSNFWDTEYAMEMTQVVGMPAGRELKGLRKRFRPFLGSLNLTRNPIATSSSGNIIVQRFDISERAYNRHAPDATSEWIIFSPEWQVIGRFSLLGAINVKLFEGCMIYGMQPGEFVEHTLVSYKLTPESADGRVSALQCKPYQV